MTTDSISTVSATRTVDGTELPAAGTWTIDPGHTSVEFVGRHLMLSTVRGRFRDVSGTVHIDEDPGRSTVSVTIDIASVESGSDDRDAHLRSADFFDVERHPTATFEGSVVEWVADRAVVRGPLTIVGVTREVDLDLRFAGGVEDPWGNHRSVFTATTELDREDWGLVWNMPLANGGLLVSRRIRLEIDTEVVLAR